MKNVIVAAATAVIVALTANAAAAQTPETPETPETPKTTTSELKVRVTGIGEQTGTVMVALGDYTKTGPTEWVATAVVVDKAQNGAVECVLSGRIDTGATLYAFLDTNGNRNLDMGANGTPTEPCALGPVTLDEEGFATIELKHCK